METIDTGFTMTHDHILDGIGSSYSVYADVTVSVCKHLCLVVNGDSCCSLNYDWSTKGCYITALGESMEGVELKPKTGVDYYKRKKCEGKYI